LKTVLQNRFADYENKWEKRFVDFESSTVDHVAKVEVEHAAAQFESWRPEMEGTLDDIRLDVCKMNKHLEHAAVEHSSSDPSAGILVPKSPIAAFPLVWILSLLSSVSFPLLLARINFRNCIFPSFDGDNPKLWLTRCENYSDNPKLSRLPLD